MKSVILQSLWGFTSAREIIRMLALAGTGILLLAGGGSVTPAYAQLVDNYCYMNDRAINPPGYIDGSAPSLNCTSQDVEIATPTFIVLDGCINNADTATFIFGGNLVNRANSARFDIGFWLNVNGGSAAADPDPYLSGVGDECRVTFFPATSGDVDGDVCGDLPRNGSHIGVFTPALTVACAQANSACPGDTLNFNAVITWKQPGSNTVCHGLEEALTAGNAAKCRNECEETGIALPELKLTKTCEEDPGNRGDTQDMILLPGDTINCTLTVTNEAGASDAENVYVFDKYPQYFTQVVDSTPTAGSVENPATSVFDGLVVTQANSFLWNIGTVAAGATYTLDVQMTVDPSFSGGDVSDFTCNQAALALDNPGPAPGGGVGPDGMINLWLDYPEPDLPGSNDPSGNGIIGELQPFEATQGGLCSITRAAISDFSVSDGGGVNAIRWRTGSEEGTLGFHIERLDPESGEYVRLNSKLLPANITAPQGSDYQFIDGSAAAGEGTYRIVEVESVGRTLVHGPFEPGKTGSRRDTNAPAALSMDLQEEADLTAEEGKYSARGRQRSPKMQQRLERMQQKRQSRDKQKHEQQGKKKDKHSSLVPPDKGFSIAGLLRRGIDSVLDFLIPSANAATAMKVETGASRFYVLSVRQIADAFGDTADSIGKRIAAGDIRITSHGAEIAWHRDNGAILFYAEELSGEERQYANNNVYWVTLESGTVAGQLKGRARRSKGFYFRESMDIEKDKYPLIQFPQWDGDFWYWDYLTGSDGLVITFASPGVTGSGDAVLTVRLQGTGITADNRVDLAVNGAFVQTVAWQGKSEKTVTATFNGALLRAAGNSLSLTPANGAAFSFVLLDGLTLQYNRDYVADNDFLRFRAEDNTAITVSGFTGKTISVFDVSNPAATVQVTGLKPRYNKRKKHWKVTIKTKPGAEYIAYANSAEVPVEVSSFDYQGVATSAQGADYVVITSDELLSGAQAIAEYRQGKGHQTAVVTIEQIVDELHDGILTPWAVREFLKQAWITSGGKTKYALIAGAGNFDFRDLLPETAGTNLVPPPLVKNRYGVFGADMVSGDVEGDDGIPEIALGRVPAFTNDELFDYLKKLQASEAGHDGWAERALWIADDAENFGSFDFDSDRATADVPRYVNNVKAYLNKPYSAAEVKSLISTEINNGVAFAYYLGHGATNHLATPHIFDLADVDDLSNTELPVFVGLTCSIARFDIPGYESLGMALVMKAVGGASTVWGPTSLSSHHWATGVGRKFLRAVFRQGRQTVGEAVVAAIREQGADSDLLSSHLFSQILGDPAATIR